MEIPRTARARRIAHPRSRALGPALEETDVLLVNGGDSLYLAHHMRESGLADLLPSLSAVWVELERREHGDDPADR